MSRDKIRQLADSAQSSEASDARVKDCGLIMPIAEWDGCMPAHWSEVQSILISAVDTIDSPKFRAKMVSEGESTSVIQGRIVRNVYQNEIVICDVSGRNPNVLFELGLRIAFDRPVVLIKDEATSFSFDIGPLEHLLYPRSLRHAPIEQFKKDLARKVAATYHEWYSQKEGDRPSYIKAFGPITKVEFDQKTEKSDQAILDAIAGIAKRMDRAETPQRVKGGPLAAGYQVTAPSVYTYVAAQHEDLPNLSDREWRALRAAILQQVTSNGPRSVTLDWFRDALTDGVPDGSRFTEAEAGNILNFLTAPLSKIIV